MTTCRIQWIDAHGTPTPDENPAIGRVQCEAYVGQCDRAVGGVIRHEASAWFPICQEHAARLSERGMHHWVFERIQEAD